jgi:hypothetical protein
MRLWNRDLLCALCCVLALGCPADILAQAAGSASAHPNASQTSLTAEAELPDSPGATQQSGAQQSQSPATPQSSSQTESSNQKQDEKLQRPVGTAAAEAPKVSGITAAQPAGVAIAPAKQKRARAIVIKVGAIVGGAAAIGAVVALTRATPSKPPGAH